MNAIILVGSIGLSIGIEYYTNPIMHKRYYGPKVAKRRWNRYNFFYAVRAGLRHFLWLFLLLLIFPIGDRLVYYQSTVNIILPIVMFFVRIDPLIKNIILYLLNYNCVLIGIFIIS